jgi:hypothetical protein
MLPVEIQQKFDAVAERYADRLIKDVRDVLSRPAYRRSGALESSLAVSVVPSTSTEPPKIVLTYAEQGFYIGYNSPMWSKMPNIERLKQWAKDVSFTGPIPGYKDASKSNLPPWKAIERRVWAIAMAKKKFDTHKPKKWKRAAGIGDILKELNAETYEQFAREIEHIMVDSLTKP